MHEITSEKNLESSRSMAEMGENDKKCPVCAETYTTEGNHLLTRLSCEHAVCSACFQGELAKKHRVVCPLCAETHQFSSMFVNEIVVKKPQEHEKDDFCYQHCREMDLFCVELGCETAICVKCLEVEHENHDYGNLQEVMAEKFDALLTDVESLKKTLQSNEDKLVAIQNKESLNSSSCIDHIRKIEKEFIRKITKMTEKMVQKVLNQKEQLDNSVNEALVKIKGNFILLESIKDTITYSGSTSHKSFTDKMEAVKKSGDQVQNALVEVRKYKHVGFQEGKTSKRKLKKLFGQLKIIQRKIPLSKIKSVNRNVMKLRLLSKTLIKSSQISLHEGNTSSGATTDEEADVEIVEVPKSKAEVIEILDDDDEYIEKMVVKGEGIRQSILLKGRKKLKPLVVNRLTQTRDTEILKICLAHGIL